MNLINTLVAFIVALGCLIVVHELGHYLVAKWCNVKVLRFAIGFGKPLWSRRLGRDRTEWAVAAFPLGGYVKMLDEREGPVEDAELYRAFNRQSVGRRMAIVVAGPVANFLLAIVLYWGLFIHGVPGMKPLVGKVAPESPAYSAGFQPGEEIKSVGEDSVRTWQDARWFLLQKAVQRGMVDVGVRSGDSVRVRQMDMSAITPEDLEGDILKRLGLSRYQPPLEPIIGTVVPGGAAEKSGLVSGDVVVSIDSQPVASWEEVVQRIRASAGRSMAFEVRGKTGPRTIAVVPEAVTEGNNRIGRIGAGPLLDQPAVHAMTIEISYGPVAALGKAIYKTWDTSVFSLKMLGKMIVGEVSLRNLSGPITIADYAGQSAQNGFASYCMFLALISISLGVLNLLPVPLLDGGHLMYYICEVFRGRPLSDQALQIGQHVGMALLFILMAFALYNDINRLISG